MLSNVVVFRETIFHCEMEAWLFLTRDDTVAEAWLLSGQSSRGWTMPKRKNPFGEITPLQRKTHVGFQEMATEQDKQQIYARTKALLFRGANHQAGLDGTSGPAQPSGRCHTHQRVCHDSEPSELPPSCDWDRLHLPPLSNGWSNHTEPPAVEMTCEPSRTLGGLLGFFSQSATGRSRHAHLQNGRGGRKGRGGGLPLLCHGCRQPVEGMGSCAHCDQEVCGSCVRCCCVCQSSYCPFCSVLNYDEAEVRSFCLSCLPTCS